MIQASLQGLPPFLLYFIIGTGYLVLFMIVYDLFTGHKEFVLMRQGNATAALAFGGAILGYSLPLSSAIRFAASPFDCAIWAMISLLAQFLAYFIAKIALPNLSQRIENNEMAAGIFVALISIAVGIISLSSMSLPVK